MTSLRAAVRARLSLAYASAWEPIDAAWLLAFRALFGLTLCMSMLRFIAYGWIDAFFVRPAFHFKYWGFAWVQPMPGPCMHALFVLLALLAACIALGLFFRVAAWGFAFGFAYLQLIDVATYLNHYYLANLLAVLLALSPAARGFSLDAWRAARSGMRVPTVARAWHHAFRFQVAVVYCFAGLAKAQSDWLVHAQPLRIWLGSKTELPVLGVLFQHDWAAPAMSWAGFLFDSSITGFLSWRRTRLAAYALVIVFHVLTRLLFPIGMFPFIMVLSTLVFFSPSWPRDLLASVAQARSGSSPEISSGASAARAVPPRRQRLIALAALSYAALQLCLPLRQLAYAGSVLWHEQGMRFSWRVMVREKNGSVTFRVRERGSDEEWYVSPRRYLTRLQEREMAGQPDLILQLAHHVRDDFAPRFRQPLEVRVDSKVSLNGRRARPLIDPRVDLARVRDGLLPAKFITQAPSEAPPHLHPI